MRESCGKNFRIKDGRKVALTGCSRSSETQAQSTDVGAVTDCEVSARMKTLTDMVLSQEDQPRTRSTVREISRGTGSPKSSVVCIIKRICSWNASRGDVRAQELIEANCATHIFLKKNNKAFEMLFSFVYNVLLLPVVKELWKSVKISPS